MTEPRHIVVYEEDAQTRALVQEWLAEAGYRVCLGNARAGGSRLAATDTSYDLVIASVCNPKDVGAQCVRDIRSMHPGTPIIAISGHFRPGLSAAGATAQTLRVEQVVAKPLSRQELLGSVRGILGETD
jgi:DNA-binding NtrC family response regulator